MSQSCRALVRVPYQVHPTARHERTVGIVIDPVILQVPEHQADPDAEAKLEVQVIRDWHGPKLVEAEVNGL